MRLSQAAVLVLAQVVATGARAAGSDAPAGAAPEGAPAVVVTAKKLQVQTLIDRKVYTISADLQSHAGTAADVLNNLPSVEVDADGNVALRGDTHVTVLVDGKPSTQLSGANIGLGLQQFPASDIARIEVMTNPPPQYRAEGSGGVINIITQKTRKSGLSGSTQFNLGDKRRYVASANLTYNTRKLSLTGGFSLRQDYKQRAVTDDRAAPDPASGALVFSREAIHEQLLRLTPLIKLGADYRPNDHQSFGASVSHQELTGHRYFDQSDASASADPSLDSQTERHSDGYEWEKNTSQEVHFSQGLWRPDETLNLALQRTTTGERERYAYLNMDILPVGPPSRDHLHLSNDLIADEFTADYALPLPHGRNLKLGYDFEDDHNAFDNFGDTVDPVTGALDPDPDITNHFRYRQRIHAAYGTYQTSFGKWSVQTGVRLEQTRVRAHLITGDLTHTSVYFRAYPSLNLDRDLSDQSKLSISLSRRINRPDPQALNPFSDHQDIHNLRAGNPDLLPQDTWSYQAGYAFDGKGYGYGVTGYYRFNRDSVTDVTQVVSADVLLITKANLPKSRSGGLEFAANGHITPKLSFRLSGDAFYSQIDYSQISGETFGAAGLRSTVGLNAKASLDYKPTAADTTQISFSRSDRRLTPQGYVGAIDLVNLGYRRQVSPDLAAVATLSDALNGQVFERIVSTPSLQDAYRRRQLGQIAYIGLVYSFGASKKGKPAAFDYDQ